MKKIAIIGCYFGNLRKDYRTWLLSCEYNSTIDWIIFTDCDWKDVPTNVKIIKYSFKDLRDYIQGKFDFRICLEMPYKLCDYKPAYGYIFDEYINEYDFWGYCDFDMIFGNIRNFITDDILENYDKIYTQGHLSLYRNDDKVNVAFMNNQECMKYKEVFTTNIIKVFDEEEGIYKIFKKEGLPVYSKYDYVNLTRFCKELINIHYIPLGNYKCQTIVFDEGKLYFVYEDNRKIEKKEVVYAHYSEKEFESNGLTKFQLTKNGVEEIDENNYFKYDIVNNLFCIKIKIMIKRFWFKVKRKLNKMKVRLIETSAGRKQQKA